MTGRIDIIRRMIDIKIRTDRQKFGITGMINIITRMIDLKIRTD